MKIIQILAAAAFALAPAFASAATVNTLNDTDSGTSHVLLDFTSHRIEAAYSGDTGPVALNYTFTVDAADAPQPAVAAAVNLIFEGVVTGLFMNWDTGTSTITDAFAFNEIAPGIHSATLVLNTLFTAPDNLIQTLNIGFDSFTGESIQISAGVAAVPLPAGLLLLVTGIGGLGLARRRRKMTA